MHPRVLEQLGNRGPVNGIVLQHRGNEALEVLREILSAVRLVLGVYTPEGSRFVVGNSPIEGVLLYQSGVEGRALRHHNEQDDTKCEQVYLGALIGLLLVDFGSHVVVRTQLGLKIAITSAAGHGTSEAEVGDLKVKVFIE